MNSTSSNHLHHPVPLRVPLFHNSNQADLRGHIEIAGKRVQLVLPRYIEANLVMVHIWTATMMA